MSNDSSVRGMSTLTRPKFASGMLLQHDDLQQMLVYTQELNRLLFRHLFGCGVVCGLEASARIDCGKLQITIDPGLALTCEGDPVHVPTPAVLPVTEVVANAKPWVVLCRRVKHCAPRPTMCGDDDDAQTVTTREREAYEIRLEATRNSACGCAGAELRTVKDPCGCSDEHYLGKCGCDCQKHCDCVLLGELVPPPAGQQNATWTVKQAGVRRMIRPALMCDPLRSNQGNTDGSRSGGRGADRRSRIGTSGSTSGSGQQ